MRNFHIWFSFREEDISMVAIIWNILSQTSLRRLQQSNKILEEMEEIISVLVMKRWDSRIF